MRPTCANLTVISTVAGKFPTMFHTFTGFFSDSPVAVFDIDICFIDFDKKDGDGDEKSIDVEKGEIN